MTGVFDITLSYEDYLASNWLLVRRRWLWRGAATFVFSVSSVYLIITALPFLMDGVFDPTFFLETAAVSVCMAIATLMMLALYWRWSIPRAARKTYSQLHFEGLVTRYEFDQSRVVVTNPRGMSNLEWKHILRWTESDHFLLLFLTDNHFFSIPKQQVEGVTMSVLKQVISDASVPSY